MSSKTRLRLDALRCHGRNAAVVIFVIVAGVFGSCLQVSAQPTAKPEQVVVSVKIIEFQMTKGVETGLSAFFQKLPRAAPFGMVEVSGNAINMADLTFPTSSAAGITVFLDRLMLSEGDIELVLQGLVDENRAFILSKPRAHVMVGAGTPTIVKTAQEIPYENTVVVGNTTQQITEFKDTGVSLNVQAPEIIDDDGDWSTTNDTYMRLLVDAEVKEEGQRIVVALDDQLASGGDFSLARNAITVPEFVSRRIKTEVWVREGQVLILGGLFRNSETKSLATVPWLSQAEDVAVAAAERVVPGNFLSSPLSSSIGNRGSNDSRRELVFLLKAETWRPSFSISEGFGFADDEETEERRRPTDVLTDVIEGITDLPQGLAEGLKGEQRKAPEEEDVDSGLGGMEP